MAVRTRIELVHSAWQADVVTTRLTNQMVGSDGFEPPPLAVTAIIVVDIDKLCSSARVHQLHHHPK